MNKITYVTGDLIDLAKKGQFDVIAHGCNCFNTMKSGIAVAMAKEFACDKYNLERGEYNGAINKLGMVEFSLLKVADNKDLMVFNLYTQFSFKSSTNPEPLDYEALTLALRKMSSILGKEKEIGLPRIGCGLAGGKWEIVRGIIGSELATNHYVTIVNYEEKPQNKLE